MSWLFSIIFAGLMFTSENNLPVFTNYGQPADHLKRTVVLDETERFEQSYPLNPQGRVSISNINGSITVETWDRNEVKLVAVKVADRRERLSEVEIKIDARPDHIRVETDYEGWKNKKGESWKDYGKLEVQFTVSVPRDAVLNAIETVNGSVYVSNITNFTKASAVNGQVKAANLTGTANLSTVNGTVEANFDSLRTGSKISLNTVNGKVNLVIPSDSNATIKADTVNGSISNEFGLPIRKGEYVGKDLYGRIGTGDVQIKMNSVNGGLAILRKKDGKTPNPATNLLPVKSVGASEDEAGDSRSARRAAVDTARANREMVSAARDAARVNTEVRKEIEEAVKEAEKELAKVKPAIAKLSKEALREAERIKTEEISRLQRELRVNGALAPLSDAAFFTGTPRIEQEKGSFSVSGTPLVNVEAHDCSVVVRGWDKSEVHYRVTSVSRSVNGTPGVELITEQKGSEVVITVSGNGASGNPGALFGSSGRTRLEVYVPKKSDLRIRTNGEIRAEGVTGDIELIGEDGAVDVRNSGGRLKVNSADGRIRIIGFDGELDSKTADGDVYLEGEFKRVTAATEDGLIVLTLCEKADAELISNKIPSIEGLNLLGDGENRWKLGKGGPVYKLSTGDGRVIFRGSGAILSN